MTATISLEELNEQSALLDRVDRKYLIKTSDLPVIWNNLDDCSRVLDINGRIRGSLVRRDVAQRAAHPAQNLFLGAGHC